MASWSNRSTPISEMRFDSPTEATGEFMTLGSVPEVTLCYVFSLVSVTVLFGLTIVAGIVIFLLLRKLRRHVTVNLHPYEEIYATRSEVSTMELGTIHFVTASGTLKRYHRTSGLAGRRLSNFSSIYAEISEAGDRRSLCQILSNSLVDNGSAQDIEKTFVRQPNKEGELFFRVNSNKTFNDESGWTDNVLYESGSVGYYAEDEIDEIGLRRSTMGHHLNSKARFMNIVQISCHKRRKTM